MNEAKIMSGNPTEPRPQERLALSRRALVLHMHRNDHPKREDDAGLPFGNDASSPPTGTWALIKNTVLSWWYHHPANIAVDIVKPLIGRYGRSNPVKLLGISAGVGVAVVMLKPWRLISIGGILLAIMKSADISGALLSMFSRANRQETDTKQLQENL